MIYVQIKRLLCKTTDVQQNVKVCIFFPENKKNGKSDHKLNMQSEAMLNLSSVIFCILTPAG